MQRKTKRVKKPTPVRNALLVASITSNVFMAALGYAVWTGEIRHAATMQDTQEVALYGEDFVTTLARR